jgi:hypothetical protein
MQYQLAMNDATWSTPVRAPMALLAEMCKRSAGDSMALPMTCRNVSIGIAWTICVCKWWQHVVMSVCIGAMHATLQWMTHQSIHLQKVK